jgi:hypothetical protein
MPQDGQAPSEDEDFDVTSDHLATESTGIETPQEESAAANEHPESSSPEPEAAAEPVSEPESETPEGGEPVTVSRNEGMAETVPSPAFTPQSSTRPIDGISTGNRPTTVSNSGPAPDTAVDTVAPAVVTADVAGKPANPVREGGGFSKHWIIDAVLVLAVVALALWGWSLKADNNNLATQVASLNANPQAVIKKQTDQLITAVSKLMNLPSGEVPTVATVSDASAAKQQSAFFANAQNGDKVLMYVKTGEAILYRPSTNKIILVAPLTLNNSAASSSNAATTTKPTTSSTSSTTPGH